MSVMEVSGLATTAGINIALMIVFFVLYLVARTQPGNVNVYFARILLKQLKEGKSNGVFSIERLTSSVDWVKAAWRPSEEEILKSGGLDAVVFLRIFVFSLKFFTVCTLAGLFILVPLNYMTGEFDIGNIHAIEHDALDKFTISNIPQGSNRIWGHFCVLYCISFIAYGLLYLEYRNITRRRVEFLRSSQSHPDHFTVLVRSIPKSDLKTYSEQVDDFFSKFYPSTYFLHHMVYQSGKLQELMIKAKKLLRQVNILRSKPSLERVPKKAGFLGLFGTKIDPLESSTRKLLDVQHSIKDSQYNFLHEGKVVPAAFVSFKTRLSASIAAQLPQSSDPSIWATEWAPEPRDVHWQSLSIPYTQLWIRRIVVFVLSLSITIIYVFPVAAILALAKLDILEKWFPPLKDILLITGTKSLISGYLPSLVLTILYYFIPSVMLILTKMEGYVSESMQEIKTCGKVYNFLLGNAFFIVTSGSLISLINQSITRPKEIPSQLATAVSGQANFFVTLIMTKGWTGFSTEILQLDVVLKLFFMKLILRTEEEGPYVQALPYYRALPNLLLFIFIGFMYTIIAPLLLPFLLIFLILGYIVFRNQILNVYEPAYETGGKYWPHVHNRLILSLVLMQITCLGMFGLRSKPTASALTIPLPILTLLFNHFCNVQFFSVFQNLSVEIAFTKDCDDESHGLTEELLRDLQKGYLCPTLQPIGTIPYGDNTLQHLLSSNGDASA
eukprot:c25231_g1_i2 orf=479-2656(-)